MSKDGPTISGGFRYGGIEAMRSGLPPKAVNPRSSVTDAKSLQAKQSLADFNEYRARTKSIGKPLPATRGISASRAAVLQKIRQMEQQEELVEERVCYTLSDDGRWKLKLVFDLNSKRYRFVKEDLIELRTLRSVCYSSKRLAVLYFKLNRISWY